MLALPLRTKLYADEWYVGDTNLASARGLVQQYHYSRSASPQGVHLHGLFLRGDFQCYGVAWWIPAMAGTINRYNPGGIRTTLTLHRLVVHPAVPTNGASFLLGRSIRRIAADGRYNTLVTYADTWRGHTGAIYKATNWHYEGLSGAYTIWLDENGNLKSKRDGLAGRNHVTPQQLQAEGCASAGQYAKHVYTMRLKLKAQPTQFALWSA